MIYASENLSLAALEMFVHVAPGLLPIDLVSISAVLPDSVSSEEIDRTSLPADWRQYPASSELKQMGVDWLMSGASLTLRVPSAINPLEVNVLLNPSHPQIQELAIQAPEPFHFDSRLFGKLKFHAFLHKQTLIIRNISVI